MPTCRLAFFLSRSFTGGHHEYHTKTKGHPLYDPVRALFRFHAGRCPHEPRNSDDGADLRPQSLHLNRFFFHYPQQKGSYYGPKKYQPYLFGRSFFGFLGLITLFYASSHAAQGDVTVLNKLSPIFVTLLAAVFMKEKLSPIQIPALALSMVGAFIVFRPSFQSDPFPLVVALLSAVTSGIAYTFLGYFKGKVDGITVIMHFSTFSVFGSLPFVIGNFVMPDLRQFMLLMLISLFGSLGQVFITYAYRFAPASEISIYNYSGILFSILLGAGILGEPVKSTSLLGGALVAVASIMVYIYGNSKKPVRR